MLSLLATATFPVAHAPAIAQVPDAESRQAANPAGDNYLGELLARAVASHPSIAAARATIRATGADLRSARWQSFPSFSVEGLWLDETNSRQANIVVEQPIWAAGRISSSIRRAKADRQAAMAAYREAVLDVMVNVSQSYREYHRLDRKYDAFQQSLTQHRMLVQTMERRVAQEVSPLADLELVRSRTAQVEQQVTSTAAQRSTSLQKLRELVGDLGVSPGGSPPPGTPLGDLDSEQFVAKALAFDPTRQRLVAEAEAAGAAASSAKASILPQLSGQYSYNETYGHRVGLVIKAQSDGGFSRFAAASAARQRQDAAELKISSTERDLRERMVSDLAEYRSARDRIASSTTARDATERVTQSYMRQFTSGRRTWLDVMNAVREATSAQSDAIDAEAGAMEARDRLVMKSGGWPFPLEDEREP